jgi:hypothetical protein
VIPAAATIDRNERSTQTPRFAEPFAGRMYRSVRRRCLDRGPMRRDKLLIFLNARRAWRPFHRAL